VVVLNDHPDVVWFNRLVLRVNEQNDIAMTDNFVGAVHAKGPQCFIFSFAAKRGFTYSYKGVT